VNIEDIAVIEIVALNDAISSNNFFGTLVNI